MEFNPEGFNLEEMDEDEKDELIQALAQSHNQQLISIISLHNAMISLSGHLYDGDVLGKRADTMRVVAFKLSMIAEATRTSLGWDPEQAQVDATFEDIVADLDIGDE